MNLEVESNRNDLRSSSVVRAGPVESFLCAVGKLLCSLIAGLENSKYYVQNHMQSVHINNQSVMLKNIY